MDIGCLYKGVIMFRETKEQVSFHTQVSKSSRGPQFPLQLHEVQECFDAFIEDITAIRDKLDSDMEFDKVMFLLSLKGK